MSVTPQLPEHIEANIREEELGFEIVSDLGNQVAREYGLVFQLPDYLKSYYLEFGIDLAKYNGDNSWTLPIPANFLVDRDGIVRYSAGDPDYRVRPEPEEMLDLLEQIQAG